MTRKWPSVFVRDFVLISGRIPVRSRFSKFAPDISSQIRYELIIQTINWNHRLNGLVEHDIDCSKYFITRYQDHTLVVSCHFWYSGAFQPFPWPFWLAWKVFLLFFTLYVFTGSNSIQNSIMEKELNLNHSHSKRFLRLVMGLKSKN